MFKLLLVLLVVRVIASRVQGNIRASQGASIYVFSTTDNQPNSSKCSGTSYMMSNDCTLRSALQYCSSIIGGSCDIYLPSESVLEFNSSLGELIVGISPSTISVHGGGSEISNYNTNCQVVLVNTYDSYGQYFKSSISHHIC
jgi:hypothetical protein